jgi:hypothetical protein
VTPCDQQKLKWFPVVTVPEFRLLARTEKNCLKVEVPVMDGWLVRVSVQTAYELPSEVRDPRLVAPVQGL